MIVGRRYSRRKVETATTVKDILALLGRWSKGGKIGSSFTDRLIAIKHACARILEAQGLPSAPRVSYTTDPKAWQLVPTKPPAPPFWVGPLKDYIATVRGFERDSPEDLAARILTAANRMESNPQFAPRFAFEIGQMWTLLRVYAIDSAGARRGGKRTGGRQSAKAREREQLILREASKMTAVNRGLQRADVARILAERGFGGAEAIRKILRRKKAG